MTTLHSDLGHINVSGDLQKEVVVNDIVTAIEGAGYNIVERNDQKPWGAYFRIDGSQAASFVTDFFPGLSIEEARLGIENAELSPKILLVAPAQRLSWQYHDRRAERWAFLTVGAYNKSTSDVPGEPAQASVGDVVQFAKGERHRLIGDESSCTLVAEIWQHSDLSNPSNEDDIVRLADDYNR